MLKTGINDSTPIRFRICNKPFKLVNGLEIVFGDPNDFTCMLKVLNLDLVQEKKLENIVAMSSYNEDETTLKKKKKNN
jgi:hypothetical protein